MEILSIMYTMNECHSLRLEYCQASEVGTRRDQLKIQTFLVDSVGVCISNSNAHDCKLKKSLNLYLINNDRQHSTMIFDIYYLLPRGGV